MENRPSYRSAHCAKDVHLSGAVQQLLRPNQEVDNYKVVKLGLSELLSSYITTQ